MTEKLRQGKVLVRNWHVLSWDTEEQVAKKRSVDKRGVKSDEAYVRDVLGEMANAHNILVINDEAHHAWRVPAESKVRGLQRRYQSVHDVRQWPYRGLSVATVMPISRDNRRMPRTFGPLVKRLKDDGVLPAELARHLWKFNDSVNVASKHFDAYMPTRRLRERTFSVMEAAWALVLMRKLSM